MIPRSRPEAAFRGVIAAGALARAAYVWRPLDHRFLAPWREADYAQIARNFAREGMNILYPRVDWRGDTPGFAEMEFPLLPWVGAALRQTFGGHEGWMRAFSALCSIVALLVFARLARAILPRTAALFATAAFAANPFLIYLATALQPESTMLLFVIAAVALLARWDRRGDDATLLLACAAAGLAIAAKSPAAYLGILFALAVLARRGAAALRSPVVYVGALLALAPGVLWYGWASRFWREYGLSLGVSNESHFLGTDMLLPPYFLLGILKWETIGVFTPAGWVLAGSAVFAPRGRLRLPLAWYASVFLLYLVTARTSGDDWAFYYHCASVGAACLLMGTGLGVWLDRELPSLRRFAGAQRVAGTVAGVLAAGVLVAEVVVAGVMVHRRDTRTDYLEMRRCLVSFAALVPPEARIVIDGGSATDEYGKPVAHNESMAFAWMDRKGFNYATQELSLTELERITSRGGRYWIGRDREVGRLGGEVAVTARFRRLARCPEGIALFDLTPARASS